MTMKLISLTYLAALLVTACAYRPDADRVHVGKRVDSWRFHKPGDPSYIDRRTQGLIYPHRQLGFEYVEIETDTTDRTVTAIIERKSFPTRVEAESYRSERRAARIQAALDSEMARREAWIAANAGEDPVVHEWVRAGQITPGLPAGAVRAIRGEPTNINRRTSRHGINEQWVYGSGVRADCLHFENGILTSIHQAGR